MLAILMLEHARSALPTASKERGTINWYNMLISEHELTPHTNYEPGLNTSGWPYNFFSLITENCKYEYQALKVKQLMNLN